MRLIEPNININLHHLLGTASSDRDCRVVVQVVPTEDDFRGTPVGNYGALGPRNRTLDVEL